MKIESPFSDYYDHVESSFYSPGTESIKFKRKTESCSPLTVSRLKSKMTLSAETIKEFIDKKEGWSISFFALGFCGHLYRGVKIEMPNFNDVSYTLTGSIYLPSKKGIRISNEIQENARKHFSFCGECSSFLFDEIDSPSFVIVPGHYQSISVIKNPRLADYHFQKTVNSFDVFQRTFSFLLKNKNDKNVNLEPSNFWIFNPFFSPFLSANK